MSIGMCGSGYLQLWVQIANLAFFVALRKPSRACECNDPELSRPFNPISLKLVSPASPIFIITKTVSSLVEMWTAPKKRFGCKLRHFCKKRKEAPNKLNVKNYLRLHRIHPSQWSCVVSLWILRLSIGLFIFHL